MYICAEKKKIPCAASGAAGGWTFTGEGVEDVQLSGYLADHWVGSFVCAALLGA